MFPLRAAGNGALGEVFGLPCFATLLQITNGDFKGTNLLIILFRTIPPTVATLLEELDKLVFGAFKRCFHLPEIQPNIFDYGKE